MTSPEDIGPCDPQVQEFIETVHVADGLAFEGQANFRRVTTGSGTEALCRVA